MKHMFIVDCSQYCIFMDVTLLGMTSGLTPVKARIGIPCSMILLKWSTQTFVLWVFMY